jgi:hypothetical protein
MQCSLARVAGRADSSAIHTNVAQPFYPLIHDSCFLPALLTVRILAEKFFPLLPMSVSIATLRRIAPTPIIGILCSSHPRLTSQSIRKSRLQSTSTSACKAIPGCSIVNLAPDGRIREYFSPTGRAGIGLIGLSSMLPTEIQLHFFRQSERVIRQVAQLVTQHNPVY